MAGIKIVDLPALGRDLASTDLLEMSIGGTASRKITGQEIMNASKLNIGSTPIVSGTVGRLLFQGTANVLQQSSSLFWDSTNNRLGIGTSSPANPLDVVGNLGLINTSGTNRSTQLSTSGSSDNLPSISFYPATGTNVGQSFDIIPKGTGYSSGIKTQFGIWGTDFIANQTNYELLLVRATGTSYTFESFKGGTGAHRPILLSAGASNQLWAYTSGNIGINTTTDAGFKLDVNGTARVTNLNVNLSTGSIPFMGASGLVTQNNANLFWDNTNARLGIGTATPLERLHISTNGNNIVRLSSNPTNANIISFRDIDGTGQGGFLATGSTFSYGTYRSAQTNLSGGIGGIGLRTSNGANAHISFYSGNADADLSTERMRLVASTGNVLINTLTDAGFRLDVNGSARVSGATSIVHNNGSYTFGLTLTNNSTATDALTGILLNKSGTNTGQFVFCDTNYIDVNLQNTVLFSSVALQKLAFVANASNTSTGGADIYFKTRASNTNGLILFGNSQNVGINTNTDVASAIFNVTSTTKGFLPPRMTNAQRTAIVSPAVGLIVYCTDATEGLWVFKSTGWTFIV
jgi:hypothetical protein